jgi:hypothetical protein
MVHNQVDPAIPGHLMSQILVKIPHAPLYATYLLVRRKKGILTDIWDIRGSLA